MDALRIAARIAQVYPWEDPDNESEPEEEVPQVSDAATSAKAKIDEIAEQLSQLRILELRNLLKALGRQESGEARINLSDRYTEVIEALKRLSETVEDNLF